MRNSLVFCAVPLAAALALADPPATPPDQPAQTWTQFQANEQHASRMDRNTPIFQQLTRQFGGPEGHLAASAQVHVSGTGNVTVHIPMANGQTMIYAPAMRPVPPHQGQPEALVLHRPNPPQGEPELVRLQAPVPGAPGGPPPQLVDLANRDGAGAASISLQIAPGQISQRLADQILDSLERGAAAHQVRQVSQLLSGPAPGPDTWTGGAPARLDGLRTWTGGDGVPPQGYWTMPDGKVRYFDGTSRTGTWIGEQQAFTTREGGTVNLLVVRPPERPGQTVTEDSQVWSVYAANGVRLWADTYSWNALQRELGSSAHLGDIAQRSVHGEGNRLLIPTAYGEGGVPTRAVDAATGEILDLAARGGVHAFVPNAAARPGVPAAAGAAPVVRPPATLAFRADSTSEGMALENGVLAYYYRQGPGPLSRAEVGSVYSVPVGGGAQPVSTLHFRGLPGQTLPNGGAMFTIPRGAAGAPQQASLIGAWNGLGTGNTWNAWGRPLAGGGSAPLVPVANSNNDVRGNRASIERQFVDLRTGEHYALDLSGHTGVFRPVGRPAERPQAAAAAPAATPLNEAQRGEVTTAVSALHAAFNAPIANRQAAIAAALEGLRFADNPRMRSMAAGLLENAMTSDTPIVQRAHMLAAMANYFDELPAAQQARLRERIIGQLGGTLGTNMTSLQPEGGYWPHDVHPAYLGLVRALGRLGPEVRGMRIGDRTVDQFLRFNAGAGSDGLSWMSHHARVASVEALLGLGTARREVAALAVPHLLRSAGNAGDLYVAYRIEALQLAGRLPAAGPADRTARVAALAGLLTSGASNDANNSVRAAAPAILQRLAAGLPATDPARLQAVTALQGTVLNTALPATVRDPARAALAVLAPPSASPAAAPPPAPSAMAVTAAIATIAGTAVSPNRLAAVQTLASIPPGQRTGATLRALYDVITDVDLAGLPGGEAATRARYNRAATLAAVNAFFDTAADGDPAVRGRVNAQLMAQLGHMIGSYPHQDAAVRALLQQRFNGLEAGLGDRIAARETRGAGMSRIIALGRTGWRAP